MLARLRDRRRHLNVRSSLPFCPWRRRIPPADRLRATSERRAQRGARRGFLAPMLARLRERRRHPPAAAAGPAAFEASERRAERGARCAEGAPRDARLSLDTVAMRRCRVHLCVSRGGGGAPSGASVHTGSTPHGRLQLRPSNVPFPADARRRLPPAAFPPSALPRPPPPPLPLRGRRSLPRFGLRRFGLRRSCRRQGSPVREVCCPGQLAAGR
jgi:hypothetical protein